MCSRTNGHVAHTTSPVRLASLSTESKIIIDEARFNVDHPWWEGFYNESWLEKILMSSMFRRYVECLVVVLCPWVLLLEQDAEEGWDEDDPKF